MRSPARLRRCRHVMLDPVERHGLDARAAVEGRLALGCERAWLAWAAHLDAPVELSPAQVAALGEFPVAAWVDATEAAERWGEEMVAELSAHGLVLGDHPEHAGWLAADEAWRSARWWGPSAVAQAASQWSRVDATRTDGTDTTALIARRGAPPPTVPARGGGGRAVPLPVPAPCALDPLLAARNTCRNFDGGRGLPLEALAAVLARSFMARGGAELAPGVHALKKAVPSGGGLHPVDAVVVARKVDGLAPGAFHYDPVAHGLRPMDTRLPEDLDGWLLASLAGQDWFTGAAAFVFLVARFERNQWKYRNHAKAHRVVLLDAGHLGQAVAVAATAEGLGVFITAAINEVEVVRDLGLRPGVEGVLAVCGMGHRSESPSRPELTIHGLQPSSASG